MNDFSIDSHKLMYHVAEVNQWLRGEDIYPVYLEISPCGTCNHRCIFCAFDYLDYRAQFIDKQALMKVIDELARAGTKSIMYAGEGEPFLHKDLPQLIAHTKRAGIDVAVTTNAVLLNKKIAERCLDYLTWLRVSLNAGTKDTYTKIHRGQAEDFELVLKNLAQAVSIKSKNHYSCTLGAQLILLPENFEEVSLLARLLRDIGLDYLTIKPFIKHPQSANSINSDFQPQKLLYLKDQLQELCGNGFNIIFRLHAMQKLRYGTRPYQQCLGLPFFAEIVSNGNVYTCGPYLGQDNFCYGNIYKHSFAQIWEGERRQHILHWVATQLDVNQCMPNCRLDEINRYLWKLKHPPEHVNFI